MAAHHTATPERPRRRADAEGGIASILDAAVDARAGDPDASMARSLGAPAAPRARPRARRHQHPRAPHAELRERHLSVLATLEPLIERGQADGSFRADVPAARHLSMLMALMHAARGELGAGRGDDEAGRALVATILGAVSAGRR